MTAANLVPAAALQAGSLFAQLWLLQERRKARPDFLERGERRKGRINYMEAAHRTPSKAGSACLQHCQPAELGVAGGLWLRTHIGCLPGAARRLPGSTSFPRQPARFPWSCAHECGGRAAMSRRTTAAGRRSSRSAHRPAALQRPAAQVAAAATVRRAQPWSLSTRRTPTCQALRAVLLLAIPVWRAHAQGDDRAAWQVLRLQGCHVQGRGRPPKEVGQSSATWSKADFAAAEQRIVQLGKGRARDVIEQVGVSAEGPAQWLTPLATVQLGCVGGRQCKCDLPCWPADSSGGQAGSLHAGQPTVPSPGGASCGGLADCLCGGRCSQAGCKADLSARGAPSPVCCIQPDALQLTVTCPWQLPASASCQTPSSKLL